MKEIFQNFGNVTYVSLPRDKQTNRFKGFGFIEFETGLAFLLVSCVAEGALNALHLHGYRDPSWTHPIVVLTKEEWMNVLVVVLNDQ